MSPGRRKLLLVAGSLVALVLVVYAAAYFLIPKDFVQTQAMRMASRMQGGTVRWQRLETGFQGLSLGARLTGVTFRMPAEKDGAARLQARVEEVFVSFHILPLLLRRVEVKEARVSGAGIAVGCPKTEQWAEKARVTHVVGRFWVNRVRCARAGGHTQGQVTMTIPSTSTQSSAQGWSSVAHEAV